ncbi:MAG TPA: endonuclease/exonuclease/phosphatase family protein [Vicinamibacterales bacterium]|nr:endonuclease/exonuclease/phosphatase family protein [Vicinamibacterales bacterium]
MNLALLSYNIRRGGHRREGALARVIRDCAPDLVVLQEATRPDCTARIARECGMRQWASESGRSLGYMSRVEVTHHAWHQPRGSRHAFLEIVLGASGARIFGVHLAAVHAAWTERRRRRELRALLDAVRELQPGAHILAGDFNTLAPGELLDLRKLPYRLRTLVWLSGGSIQWETIRAVLAANYVDGFRMLHPDEAGLTFPTWGAHVRLDYLFVPREMAAALRSCEVITSGATAQASDHFPLLARVEI